MFRHNVLAIIALLYQLYSATPSIAAELISGTRGDLQTVTLQGVIKSGDYNKVKSSFLKSAPILPRLILDSPGGDVLEAIKIGKLIRFIQATVSVEKNRICASACFFIYLGGADRLASGAISGQPLPINLLFGYVGLHRPFLSNPSATDESLELQTDVMRKIRTYLDSNLVPSRLIDIMMSHPSTDTYWLSDSDLEDLGDFPPELEELYIAQCNYNRKGLNNYLNAKKNNNIVLSQRLKDELDVVNKCIGDRVATMRVERLEKLKTGWRP